MPVYKTTGSACADIYAYLKEEIIIPPKDIVKIPTGLYLNIPKGYEVILRSRSGLSLDGISLANGVGTIDSDYTKEIMVILQNTSKEEYVITNKMRIAQMTMKKSNRITFEKRNKLKSTGRGGFGSTGK